MNQRDDDLHQVFHGKRGTSIVLIQTAAWPLVFTDFPSAMPYHLSRHWTSFLQLT